VALLALADMRWQWLTTLVNAQGWKSVQKKSHFGQ
jgi:hypothetical protein